MPQPGPSPAGLHGSRTNVGTVLLRRNDKSDGVVACIVFFLYTDVAGRTFFDFIAPRGENVIDAWLRNDIPAGARAEIEVQLLLLRAVPQLERPAAGDMKGRECRGLIEVRVRWRRQQFRLLGYYGPGRAQVTLLIGAREKDGNLEPREACAIALRRITEIEDERGTIREHGS